MQRKSKEFKALQAEWDKKLKDTGFEDIENRRVQDLKDFHAIRFIRDDRSALDPISIANKISYYRSAEFFLHSHAFENETDRKIWALHSEGVSFRDIGKQVGGVKPMPFTTVQYRIEKLVKEMEKSWNSHPEE